MTALEFLVSSFKVVESFLEDLLYRERSEGVVEEEKGTFGFSSRRR